MSHSPCTLTHTLTSHNYVYLTSCTHTHILHNLTNLLIMQSLTPAPHTHITQYNTTHSNAQLATCATILCGCPHTPRTPLTLSHLHTLTGVLILCVAVLPVVALWVNSESLLLLLHQPPCVVQLTSQFLRIFILIIPVSTSCVAIVTTPAPLHYRV